MTQASTPDNPADPSPPIPPHAELGRHAAAGFIWVMVQTLGSKVATVVGQFVLAWLLAPEDFGRVGITYTVCSIANILQQSGAREILVQRQARLRRWVVPAMWLSLASGLAAMLVADAAAPLAAKIFKDRQLIGLILLWSTVAPISNLSIIPQAILETRLRFRYISLTNFWISIAQVLASILFAKMHMGAYAILLPWPLACIGRLMAFWLAAPPPVRWTLQLRRWGFMIGDSLRLLGARACMVLIFYGDYLTLGLTHTEKTLGIYTFAFNLSMQTMMLFGVNLEGVLFPALSKLKDDPIRQSEAFLRGIRLIALLGIPACLLQGALADPMIHAIFQPKWYGATVVTAILSVGMAFRIIGWSSQSMIQSQGRFGIYTAINIVGVITFFALVGLGAARPESQAAMGVAVGAAVYFSLEAPLSLYVAIRPGGKGVAEVVKVFLAPLAAGAVACGVSVLLANRLPPMHGRDWIRMAVIAAITGLIYVPAIRTLEPDVWQGLIARIKRLRERSPQPAAA